MSGVQLVGAAGGSVETRLGKFRPPSICHRRDGAPWQHFTRGPGDTYLWLSACADIEGHEPPAEWCSATWQDGEHQCGELIPHDVHRCCCGDSLHPAKSEVVG